MPVSYDDEFIKRPKTEIEWSEELFEELEKCSADFFYFLKYVKIIHPDSGRIEFVPRKYQKELLDLVLHNRFVIGCVARQAGKTTSVGAYALWYSIFHEDKFVAIGSNSAKSAQDFLYRVKIMYEELPLWLKPGVVKYNELSLLFENGTRIDTAATSKNAFRGRTANLMILDEFAHLLSDKIADQFYTANFPAISESKESKLVILSTPKGMHNLFARLYKDAENGFNQFKYFKVSWREVPGRDEEWKKTQLESMGNDLVKFRQEFEADFIDSSNTLIDPDILRSLINSYVMPSGSEIENKLKIFEKPIQGALYVIGGDPSKGAGRNYAAAQVLKIVSTNPIKLEQVAVFNDNKTDVFQFAEILVRIGYYYNTALIMVESNAEGAAVVNSIWWIHEYPALYNSGSKSKDLGVRATKTSKTKAVLLMKRFIEDSSLLIRDRDTIEQLTDFSEINNKFKCVNTNDDLISALYWACYATSLNILESGMTMNKKDGDDIWGILTETKEDENWSWLTTPSTTILL